MMNSDKNSKNTNKPSGDHFLKGGYSGDKDLKKGHKEYLGMDIPQDYFEESKRNILNSLLNEKKRKPTVFRLRPILAYSIAASVLLLVSLAIWMPRQGKAPATKAVETEQYAGEYSIDDLSGDDFLLNSLLVNDTAIHHYVDDFVVNNIIVHAELSEQKLENIFLNTLFVEDSLIDAYIDSNLVENIIL